MDARSARVESSVIVVDARVRIGTIKTISGNLSGVTGKDMIHLHYSFRTSHSIVSVSSSELNDKELFDQIITLSREQRIVSKMQLIEVVKEDGRRQNLEVLDLGPPGPRTIKFLGHLQRHYPVQLDVIEFNERWHSPDHLSEPNTLDQWPVVLQSLFRNLLTYLRERFLTGDVPIGTITKACEFADMAARWSPSCLEEALAFLVGAIKPSQPFHVQTYLSNIGINFDQHRRLLRLAKYAALSTAEWSLYSNVLSWHACTQAMAAKGWHQQLESLSAVGENIRDIRESSGRGYSQESLNWFVDPLRDRILQYAMDPQIDLNEFLDIASQDEPAGFRLVRRLSARSAFKVVYLAEDQMGKQVVLKRYKSWHTGVIQTLKEGLSTSPEKMISKDTITDWLGLIRHSNIQPCMLVTNASGEPFILEPLLQHTLDYYVDRSDRKAIELVSTLRGIVDAVLYLHERGVIHADIKPDNIGLIGTHAILLDFGIATFDAQEPRGNAGSIKIRAPELFSQIAVPTTASDIWAIGATLMCIIARGEYPILSKEESLLIAEMGQEQRQAFEHSVQRRVRAYQNDPAKLEERLSRTLYGIPDRIRNIIYSACEISPAERPSARELLHAFDVAIDAIT